MEDEVKRVLRLASLVSGAAHQSITIDRDEDGWLITTAGHSKHGGTIHTTLFGLEQSLRERLKSRRAELQKELLALASPDEDV